MKRLPGWVARDLRPTEAERSTSIQPIDPGLLAYSIRHTEPDSLWLRSTIRKLREMPEAEPWARRPDEPAHGGKRSNFPNAPPTEEPAAPDGAPEPDDDGAETPQPELTDLLPDLDQEGEPGTEALLTESAENVPQAEPDEGLEGGDVILLSEAAQAILDAEDAIPESEDSEDNSEDLLASLPADPTQGPSRRSRRALPLSAYDEPVPTPRWLMLLLLLLLGLAGGQTETGKKALGDLTREELSWSLNGQVGSGPGIVLGPGIIVNGHASLGRVSIGQNDATVQLTNGLLNAEVTEPNEKVLIVQAGPAVVSTQGGRIEVLRDDEQVQIWVENGEVIVQTQSESYHLVEGEQLVIQGNDGFGTSETAGGRGSGAGSSTGSSNGSSNASGQSGGGRSDGNAAGSTSSTSSKRSGNATDGSSTRSGGGQSSSKSQGAPSRSKGTSTAPGASTPMAPPSKNAPAFSEPAGNPFDDVLQALDPTTGLSCDDEDHENAPLQENAP